MSFLNKIKSSIYDQDFYSRVVDGTEKGSFRFFLKLSFSLALVFAIFGSIFIVPRMKELFKVNKEKIELSYPRDLEVKIEKGIATTNAIEPYYVKVPGEGIKAEAELPAIENILVIDTKEPFTVEKYESYKTLGLLTRDSLVVEDGNGKITITPLKKFPDFTVNYANITKWLFAVEPVTKMLVFIMPAFIFFLVFIAYLFKLVYLLFAAGLVWVIGRMKNLNLSYKQSYKISIYAVTLPTLLGALSYVLHFPVFAFLPTIIFMIAVWVNLKSSSVEIPGEAPTV